MTNSNTFGARSTITVEGKPFTVWRLDAVSKVPGNTVGTLPFSLKVLLENLLRNEDGVFVSRTTSARWPRGT